MKLQVALDCLCGEDALSLCEQVSENVDILEAGTPLIKIAGIDIVRQMKEKYPDKKVLADLKTMDVGKLEADFAFEARADIVTVLGAADDETIKGAVEAAQEHGGKVMVDLINVSDKPTRAKEAEELGAHYIGVHSGIDQQIKGEDPLEDLKSVMNATNLKTIVAGGIKPETVDTFKQVSPEVVVVGGGITKAQDPCAAAKQLKGALQ